MMFRISINGSNISIFSKIIRREVQTSVGFLTHWYLTIRGRISVARVLRDLEEMNRGSKKLLSRFFRKDGRHPFQDTYNIQIDHLDGELDELLPESV